MKKIEAIIRHYKLEEVKNGLNEIGIEPMSQHAHVVGRVRVANRVRLEAADDR